MNTVTQSPGWLNDSVITASQKLLLQNFPHIEGLQPPTLQQVRGVQVHREEVVQIINLDNRHWCVVSNSSCSQGEVNVHDTMYPEVQSSSLPIIASLVFNRLPTLKVNMVDVGRQTNRSDCGMLAVAIAYDLCPGKDQSTVEYDHNAIRSPLTKCLKNCSLSQFPIQGQRLAEGVTSFKDVELYCTCRMPEMAEDRDKVPMAECDVCKEWYHQSCIDIPNEVFDKKNVHWKCKFCNKK